VIVGNTDTERQLMNATRVTWTLKYPAHKKTYMKNASAYKTKLDALDCTYRQTLATCEKKVVIHGGHFAFNYLARRYGLIYESAYPGSPDAEPTARQIISLKKMLKEHDLDTVFYEELIEPRMAEVLAKETGSRQEGKPGDKPFVSGLRSHIWDALAHGTEDFLSTGGSW
jgi:ABC-type Zn uptake system ZnuABC Zn-binding protein ZnuA